MKKSHLLLMSVFAMLALGAVGASSASAAACTLGTATEWCLRIAGELTASATFTGSKDPGTGSQLELEGLPTVECEKAASAGEFKNGAAPQVAKLTISFSGNCKYTTNNTGCTFKEPITTVPIKSTLTKETSVADVLFEPETGTFFAFVQATGTTCENSVKIAITGKQLCTASLTAIEAEALTHLIECLKTGSELKNGTKKAAFELSESVVLTGGPRLFSTVSEST